MNPIETLKHEHRLIEKALTALLSYAERAESGGDAPRADLAKFATFIKNFADTCHHGKEEDILFTAMTDHGMPREFGPIAVMLGEHETGRALVRKLAALGSGEGELTADETAEMGRAARDFVHLLRDHISKEDGVLYPMAVNVLPAAVMDDIGRKFEAFERDEMGDGAHERFHALADELIARYGA